MSLIKGNHWKTSDRAFITIRAKYDYLILDCPNTATKKSKFLLFKTESFW